MPVLLTSFTPTRWLHAIISTTLAIGQRTVPFNWVRLYKLIDKRDDIKLLARGQRHTLENMRTTIIVVRSVVRILWTTRHKFH